MPKDSRKDSDKDRHTASFEDGGDTLQRIQVITGTGRRRRWPADVKAAIVAESFASDASVSAVARRHDISPSLLFLWRHQAAPKTAAGRPEVSAPAAFVPVTIVGHGVKSPPSTEEPSIEIDVGTVRIRLRGAVDWRALREVLAAVGVSGR